MSHSRSHSLLIRNVLFVVFHLWTSRPYRIHPCALRRVIAVLATWYLPFICSGASCLSNPKAQSRGTRGHFFVSSDRQVPPKNGAVLSLYQIMRAMMSSICETENGTMFMNSREAVPATKTLEGMIGHPQP